MRIHSVIFWIMPAWRPLLEVRVVQLYVFRYNCSFGQINDGSIQLKLLLVVKYFRAAFSGYFFFHISVTD